jgi:hypothetical protein
MLPDFLVEEMIVRESGESAVFDVGQYSHNTLALRFCITHAVEQQSIELEIYGSKDGERWDARPLLSLPAKCYCGDYHATLPPSGARHLKAVWRVKRWARSGQRPYFRFYVFAEVARTRSAAA